MPKTRSIAVWDTTPGLMPIYYTNAMERPLRRRAPCKKSGRLCKAAIDDAQPYNQPDLREEPRSPVISTLGRFNLHRNEALRRTNVFTDKD